MTRETTRTNNSQHRHNMDESTNFDVIVLGVGSMGAAACSFLAERGYKVLGLEQFEITHDRGSHTGQSRIIRKAYYEKEDYVPLLSRAYENWKILERQSGANIYEQTGIIYIGQPNGSLLTGIQKSSAKFKIPIQHIPDSAMQVQFPQFLIPEGFNCIMEPDAGFVTPERAILSYAENARKLGAVIRTNDGAIEWRQEGGKLKVKTLKNVYTCEKLVITAGAWTSKLVPAFATELTVTRQMIAWMNPDQWDIFKLDNFPCWFIEDPHKGIYYGFPILPVSKFDGPLGLKVAHHYPGEITNPDVAGKDITTAMVEDIRYLLSKYIPLANTEFLSTKTCLYTNSRDENFIIDFLPGYNKRVVIACGFSGHGFKFASVVGEILADLTMQGRTDMPIDFLSMKRLPIRINGMN